MKEKETFLTKNSIVCLLALLCCFLWGSAFPCIKIGYQLFEIGDGDTWSQILFAGIRFTLAGILVVCVCSLKERKLLAPKKTSWGMVFKISMCQTAVQYVFFYVGLAHTTGVKGSIMEGANVFMAVLLASLVYHQESLTPLKGFGCLIGFAGVVLVNLGGGGLGGGIALNGEGFLLIACLSYAFSSVLIKIYSRRENPVVLSGYQFILGGLIMTVAGIAFGGSISGVSFQGYVLLLYMALISAVAYSVWSVLLKYNSVSKVAVFGFTTPIFGVVLSAAFLHENSSLSWLQSLSALALVCAGIYIVNREEKNGEK